MQKFELRAQPPPVQLAGPPPGRLVLDGDLHPIKRSLSHLIDNALRHAPGRAPVPLSLRCQGLQAPVLIADDGPGLPLELAAWPNQQASLRDLPLRRADGGIGRPGLAIAQRVALLHGGMPAAWRQPSAAARATGWHDVVPGAAAGGPSQPKRAGNARSCRARLAF